MQFDLKEFNKDIRQQISEKALESKPYLVIIQVGNNPASDIYVRNKIKACEECNIKVKLEKLPEYTTEDMLLYIIDIYNSNSPIDATYYDDTFDWVHEAKKGDEVPTGIIVQMPLPKHINPIKICKAIDPNKDVDGFNPINVGRLALGEKCFIPATVKGISSLLTNLCFEGIIDQFSGKNCVIIGRSNIVGKPMALEMINRFNCTVSVCNSHTDVSDLCTLCMDADIIICAIGKPKFLDNRFIGEYSMKKPIVIDVGINRLENDKIVGDCDYEAIKDYCIYITPVPGGVGPLTITGLLHNVAYYKDYQI